MQLNDDWVIMVLGFQLISSILMFFALYFKSDSQTLFKKSLFILSVAVFILSSVSWLFSPLNLALAMMFMFINLVFALNSFRGFFGRYKQSVLPRKLGATWWRLVLLQIIIAVFVLFIDLNILLFFMLAVSIALLISTIVNVFRFRLGNTSKNNIDVPTVSLLIPARNEDHVLNDALTNFLALDYPKLEIIVLDDCSHDRTPSIVKNHAHQGVRFIPGNAPPEDWTGKNHALQKLLDESSGEYLVFCDADIRMDSSSLTRIVNVMQNEKLSMISILPGRRHFDLLPNIFQSLLELWLVVSPSKILKQTYAVGSCMAFSAAELKRLGGFTAYADKVTPEISLAKAFNNGEKSYRMYMHSSKLDITTRKRMSSIIETQVRTFYPIMYREPALVIFVTSLLFASYIALPIYAAFTGNFLAWTIVVVGIIINLVVTTALNPNNWFIASANLPFAVVLSTYVLIRSMVGYEFGKVVWKQRNICYTSLETIPHLPKID